MLRRLALLLAVLLPCAAGAQEFIRYIPPAGGGSGGGLAADPAACPANQWVIDLDIAGALTCSQPAFSSISGTTTLAQSPASQAVQVTIANEAGTGTTANYLAILTGAPSTAIVAGTSDTSGIVGVVVSGAGTTGSATIARTGTASCAFDGATTAGDYVIVSTTAAGKCKDSGAGTYPTGSIQVLGRVLSTNVGAGTYSMTLHMGTQGTAVPAGSDKQVQFNDASAFGGDSGLTYAKATDILTHTHDAVGATSADGYVLQNTTAAAAGAQQYSPRFRLRGYGWKTNSTAASQSVDCAWELRPVQAAAAPTGNYVLSCSIAGGAYSDVLTITSAGIVTAGTGFTSPTYVDASTFLRQGSSYAFSWLSSTQMWGNVNGKWRASNAAATFQIVDQFTAAPTVAGACGSSPAITGVDSALRVTTGTGSPTSCAVTFAATWPNAPVCSASASTTVTPLNIATTTTTVTVSSATLTAGEVLHVVCRGF